MIKLVNAVELFLIYSFFFLVMLVYAIREIVNGRCDRSLFEISWLKRGDPAVESTENCNILNL